MKKLAIGGCGKLGKIVADAIINGIIKEYELTGV
jgi:aspartate dehydrogenase